MEKMNVAMYYKNNDVRIQEQTIPEISDDELLIKIMASGICGSDVMEWYRIKKAPLVLGHEMAGEVVKKGKNVENFKIGERVFATHHVPCNTCRFCLNNQHTLCDTLHKTKFYPGGFAEYLRLPAINVDRGTFKLPDTMSYDEATFIEPLACVVRGFRIADIKSAQTHNLGFDPSKNEKIGLFLMVFCHFNTLSVISSRISQGVNGALLPGETKEFNSWFAIPMPHEKFRTNGNIAIVFEVSADPEMDVEESNEQNNQDIVRWWFPLKNDPPIS